MLVLLDYLKHDANRNGFFDIPLGDSKEKTNYIDDVYILLAHDLDSHDTDTILVDQILNDVESTVTNISKTIDYCFPILHQAFLYVFDFCKRMSLRIGNVRMKDKERDAMELIFYMEDLRYDNRYE